MSGKFMKIRRVFIPTLTALIIASQLVGCSSASEKEMLNMINNQQSICIELAVPAAEEQGTETTYNWKELASLDNYPEFRMGFEDALNVTAFGEGGKNGTMYVDLEGNHTNNSTLFYAMMNKKFRAQVDDTDTNRKLVELAKSTYTDVESDAMAKLAYLNAYFNIIEDNEPNYFNGNSALSRAEFLSAVYRTGNPVQELTENADFINSVDPSKESEHTLFAQQMLDYSYLNLSEKSLNEQTFGGDITRAEAIFTLVKYFYSNEYDAVTGKEQAFADTKNGGDIASKVGFIETKKDEETKEKYQVFHDYWMSYELQYAIDNPDKGMPDDLYKAMVVAKQVGLVTGSESRWDEPITKAETLNFLLRIYENMNTATNADRGEAVGAEVNNTVLPSEGNNGEGVVDPLSDTEEFTETDSGLSPSNITVNEDGSYSFTDDFMIAVQGINGAAGLSDKRLDEALQIAASVIVNEHLTDEQDIVATIETEISIQEYNQVTDNTSSQNTDSQNVDTQTSNQVQESQPNYSDTQPNNTEQVIGGPGFTDFSGITHDENASTGGVGTNH